LPVHSQSTAPARLRRDIERGEDSMRTRFCAAAKLATIVLLAQGVAAEAADVKIIAGAATAPVMAELGPKFERATGHKLLIQYGVTGSMKRQIESGEAFDLAIVPAALIDEVSKQGRIAAGTRTDLVRVGFGVGVRAGAAKPDIGSVDAFKSALLNATSISYVPEGATGIHLARVFERLGITEQMKAKTRPQQSPERIGQAVASGEVELGFGLTTVLTSVAGVELVGLLPSELQNYLVLAAGVSASAKEPEAAKALIRLLTAEDAVPVLKAKGMEPIVR
jgi:molybdate transport system substrate-binding protein